MKYTVLILPSAQRELGAIPQPFRRQIDARIISLADDPRPSGCKKLKGLNRGLYRIRQGDYRIIYDVQDQITTVTVVKVGDRKDVYD